MRLLDAPQGVGDYVRAFVVADNPDLAREVVDAQVTSLCHAETEYQWRHRRGFEFAAAADRALDAIELIVLPNDPCGAVRLLEKFFESDTAIVDGCLEDVVVTPGHCP